LEFSINSRYYFGEAKQCWPKFGRSKDNAIREVIINILQSQVEVNQVLEKGYKGLGIVFISPRIPFKDKDETNLLMNKFIAELINLKTLSLSWIFPLCAKGIQPPIDHKNHRFLYPGIILCVIPSNSILSIGRKMRPTRR
jgi:hypothetical protein